MPSTNCATDLAISNIFWNAQAVAVCAVDLLQPILLFALKTYLRGVGLSPVAAKAQSWSKILANQRWRSHKQPHRLPIKSRRSFGKHLASRLPALELQVSHLHLPLNMLDSFTSCAGVFGATLTFPLDRAKTLLQLADRNPHAVTRYTGVFNCLQVEYRTNGFGTADKPLEATALPMRPWHRPHRVAGISESLQGTGAQPQIHHP